MPKGFAKQGRSLVLGLTGVNRQKTTNHEFAARNRLAISSLESHSWVMGLPVNPVTLTPEQVEALAKSLSTMRHDINNHLSLVVAASELIKFKPADAERHSKTLNDQPPKISEAIGKFSAEFEKAFGITRD